MRLAHRQRIQLLFIHPVIDKGISGDLPLPESLLQRFHHIPAHHDHLICMSAAEFVQQHHGFQDQLAFGIIHRNDLLRVKILDIIDELCPARQLPPHSEKSA